jgi:diguanylate cyclase (GGDEF)-like protein
MATLTESLRILVVEDNPADLAVVESCLKDFGQPPIAMTRVTRLAEALDALRKESFHVVISDLNLPDAEGLQTFHQLKLASPESAFVLVTGMDDKETCMQAVRSGAQEYLVKGEPGPQRLQQSVRNAIVRQGILRRVSNAARDLLAANSELEVLACTDPLTGLYNRRGFDGRLAQERSRIPSRPASDCVVFVDIDDFKAVNDRFGHDQGDLALLEVSHRILGSIRTGDVAARVGGDEFMVWLPGTPLEGALEIAERIRRTVCGTPIGAGSGSLPITVSVGVASQGQGTDTAHSLLARTHGALAQSKALGKNRVFCEEPLGAPAGRPAPQELHVLRRPFYYMPHERILGYEYLWRSSPGNETAGALGPADVPVAVLTMGHCLDAAAQMPADLECHIRLHYSDLDGVDPAALLRLLPQGLDPALVCLELRDLGRAPASDPVHAVLRSLLEGGVRLVLHDADLMQLGMERLLRLEPAWVKLGRGRFSGVAADPFKEAALRKFLKMVEGLGARVIACGVENREDLDVLLELGVFYGQGPLWSGHS